MRAMTEITDIQIGDIVRIRQAIGLMPIDDSAPDFIPAGIFGEVVDISRVDGEEIFYCVEFHEPYEFASEIAIRSDMLEVMFRFSLN